jgi:hypothetical protein
MMRLKQVVFLNNLFQLEKELTLVITVVVKVKKLTFLLPKPSVDRILTHFHLLYILMPCI